ncbi:MAG: fumarylacetoacetate hydrolase family protein [Methanobacterium sp.]
MKILKFFDGGKERTGLLEDNNIIELSCSSIEAISSFYIDNYKKDSVYKISDIQIKSPVSPSKIVCVGLNYRDHAEELNMDIPDEPIIFLKPPTTVIGHLDSIIYPNSSNRVDYEAEIGIIISKEAKKVKAEEAEGFIGGYTAFNDVTARDLQQKDGQWTRAKSFDTFAPIGPCIETDLNPMDQNITLKLNDEIKQKSNTKNMIFDAYELVEFISSVMTLNPGDIIATGTPPGVGSMNIGDDVEIELQNIGKLRNYVKK